MYIIEKIANCTYIVKNTIVGTRRRTCLDDAFYVIGRFIGLAILFTAGVGIGWFVGAIFRGVMIGLGIW